MVYLGNNEAHVFVQALDGFVPSELIFTEEKLKLLSHFQIFKRALLILQLQEDQISPYHQHHSISPRLHFCLESVRSGCVAAVHIFFNLI